METTQTANNGTLADLFKPLEPVTAKPEAAPQTGSNSATATASPEGQKPDAGGGGSTAENDILSGLKHTNIPGFSASGTPGQPAPSAMPNATPGSSVSLGGMVQGEWAVAMMDSILPSLLVAAMYAGGIKLRKSEMQMTEKERSTVAPIMQKCLDSILLNFDNPWSALALTLGFIYGGKLMEKGLIGWIDKTQERKQEEVIKERIAAAELAMNPAKYDTANQSAHAIATGQVHTPTPDMPFTEEQIRDRMKKGKCNREKAIEFLKKKMVK
jgi:hypothetical protein